MREDLKASKLRDLADAIDRRAKANTLPGIPCPPHIKFEGPGNSPMGVYGDNPILLEAMKREIFLEWDRLREQALARMETRVEALSVEVATFVAPTLAEPTAPR